MLWAALAVIVVVFAGIVLGRHHLSRGALIAAGIGFAVIGLVPLAMLEWSYSAARTTPVTMPVALDRAGTIRVPPFFVAHPGPYDIWLVFDHSDGTDDFDCWTGYHDMEAACPPGDPPLDISWRVREDAAPIATGGTDWTAWRKRQHSLAPSAMAKARQAFRDFQKRVADPSNRWPFYDGIGTFAAQPGARYDVELTVRRPAGPLARLNPKLVIGLGAAATRGLGAMVTSLAILWVLAGAVLVMIALRRKQDT